MDLHYQRMGDGPPLLVVHGLFGSGANWRSVARELAATRSVYLLDQRNHGRSPHAERISYSLLADDLGEFLDARGIEAAAIMGHSMGGKAAMHFALARPARVERLVVVDTAPRAGRGDELTGIAAAMRSIDPQALGSRERIDRALAGVVPDERTRRFLLTNLRRDEAGELAWRLNMDAIVASLADISAWPGVGGVFEGPTLFVAGGDSDHLTPSDGVAINESFPAAELVSIAGAGHWVHADRPRDFLAIVGPFLAS